MTRKLIVSLDSGLTITVRPPTVKQFYEQRPAIKKNSETDAMICDKGIYDITAKYVPYSPTYQELVARVAALEASTTTAAEEATV